MPGPPDVVGSNASPCHVDIPMSGCSVSLDGEPITVDGDVVVARPGGAVWSPGGVQVFIMGNAMVRKSTYGNYPAQLNIMRAVYEGLQVPMDAALRIETRYFARTCLTPQATAMIRTLFQSMQALNKGAARPKDATPTAVKKAAVLGAGMMGAGIAYSCARAGMEVVLKDVSDETFYTLDDLRIGDTINVYGRLVHVLASRPAAPTGVGVLSSSSR